jgi:hypothetical protein
MENEKDMVRELINLWDGQEGVSGVLDFESAGLLTRNKGVVVEFDNGARFQVTVVKELSSPY